MTHRLSSDWIGSSVLDLACLQRRAGLSVRILYFGSQDDALIKEAIRQGIEVLCSPRHLNYLKQLHWIRQGVAIAGCRVVHVHSPHALWRVAPELPAARARIIYTRHDASSLEQWYWRAIHAWCRRYVDALVFASPCGLQVSGWARAGWKREPIVIEPGVRLDVDAEWAPAPDGRVRLAGVASRQSWATGRFLLESVATLPPEVRTRVSVQLVADGAERRRLRALAEARLPDVPVKFLSGHGGEWDELYREVDVLAVSAVSDEARPVILEAMARWIPVVAPAADEYAGLLAPNVTGLLTPRGDVRAFGAALARLVSEAGLRDLLGEGARRWVEEHHSRERAVRLYLELYGLRDWWLPASEPTF